VHRPDTPDDRRIARELLLGRIQLALGLTFLGSFVAFAVRGRFPVPYRDDWDWLSAQLTRPMTISGLFEPHNEHLIPLPRLLFGLQYSTEGTSFLLSFLIALLAQLSIGWVFWRQIRGRWSGDAAMRAFAWGTAAVSLFVTYQLQSIVFVAAILFPLVQLFVVLACHAAADASTNREEPRRMQRWAVALGASLAAALTTTNGLVAPGIVALFALGRRRRADKWMLAALVLLQVACVATYVLLVRRPWDRAPTAPGQGWSFTSARAMLEFFLSFFSSGLLYSGAAIGVAAGTAVFIAGVWCLAVTAREGARSRDVERFACGLLLFTMASAAMTTVGRAQFGIAQAAQSRYATYTLVYWSAVVVWMLSRLDGRLNFARWKVKVMAAGVVVAAFGLVVQAFVGLVWIAKKDHLRLAALTLATGVDDAEWVSTLHPIADSVYRARALLVADGKWRLADPRIGTGQAVSVSNSCDGEVHLDRANGVAGWRVTGVLHNQSDEVLIVDRDGIAVGLAEAAPVVAVPNPSQMDVVSGVWRELTRQVRNGDHWIGLARVGAGPPYTAVALDEDGRAECQLPAR
jgi:hypothetical protein